MNDQPKTAAALQRIAEPLHLRVVTREFMDDLLARAYRAESAPCEHCADPKHWQDHDRG